MANERRPAGDSLASRSWITIPRSESDLPIRLFCFPHAGGGASTFSSWDDQTPAQISVCTVNLPGRESRLRDAPMTRMDDIVSALTEAIGPLLDKPCAFFGQSMGGLIAFELTRALRRQGLQTPFHLFVSATRAPQTERQIGQLDELSDADFMSEVQQRYGGVPPEVTDHQELLDIVLPTLRADFRVMHNYCYVEEPPLDIPVSVFGGLKDSEVTEDSLRAWRDATRGDCKVRLYPGGHFVSSENERAVINSIQADLAMSGAGTT